MCGWAAISGAVLSTWVVGCSAGIVRPLPEYNVSVDASFSDRETEEILAALDEWHARTDREVTFRVRIVDRAPPAGTRNSVYVVRADAGGGCPGGVSLPAFHAAGKTYGDGAGHVICLAARHEKYLTHMTLHEFGHLMGLHHRTDRPSVMAPNLDDPTAADHLTDADVATFDCLRAAED